MKVKEYLLQHPQDAFSFMTPEGIVDLSPSKAAGVLSGMDIEGHPGDPELSLPIKSETLLEMNVVGPGGYRRGAWHAMAAYAPEQTRQPDSGPEIDANHQMDEMRMG